VDPDLVTKKLHDAFKVEMDKQLEYQKQRAVEREHKMLKQEDDTVTWTTWDTEYDQAVALGYAWISGFRPYLYWQNTTNCFNRMTNFTYLQVPWLQGNLSDADQTLENKIDMTLFLVKNFTEHLWYCNSAWQQMNKFWFNRMSEYGNNVGTFFLSMLQNLLAKVISLTNLYFSIEANLASGNLTGVHYDIARIVRVLIIFDPIEPIDDTDLDRINIETEEQLEDPDLNPSSFNEPEVV